ncbi:MAG: hypothetical protein QOE32_1285, partial [Pseudonocardiales bacterium]|nr:hypothetical protein [Pseudonocardiales bacterium]
MAAHDDVSENVTSPAARPRLHRGLMVLGT